MAQIPFPARGQNLFSMRDSVSFVSPDVPSFVGQEFLLQKTNDPRRDSPLGLATLRRFLTAYDNDNSNGAFISNGLFIR